MTHTMVSDHPHQQPMTTPARAPRRWPRRLRAALARMAYAAIALPIGLIGLVVALGGARTVGRWHRELARRLLAVPITSAASSPRGGETRRVLAHCLVSLPVNLVAFVLVVPVWAVFLTRGVLYPAFGADNLAQSWGGPTLAGAWVVHFIQGPPLLLIAGLVLSPVSRTQARLIRRYLDADR